MNTIVRGWILFILISHFACAAPIKDGVFIDTIYVTDDATRIISNSISPTLTVMSEFTNQDKMIYYVAEIGVINPTKKMYDVEIICVDSKGSIVLQGTVKRSLSGFSRRIGKDIIKGYMQTLGMDPKPGAMVNGQRIPLKSRNDYFIKLYFEKKLIGITKFHYFIIKN